MTEYNIYVGLNDQFKKEQIFGTEKYISILRKVCKSYQVAFSFDIINGGYLYDNGDYVEETSLHITLLDQTKETVNEIAKDLCTFFNQESVMITHSSVETYYIRGESKVMEVGRQLTANDGIDA